MKKLSENDLRVRGKCGLIERAIHQRHPAIAGALVEAERVMPHAQPGMAPRFLVTRRAAKTADQELPQAMLGARQVVFRIHRPEHIVARHLRVKRRH